MRYEPGGIFFHLAVANCEPVGERKQGAVTIGCCWSPFLLLELPLNVLSRDRFCGILAEPSEQDFHAARIAAVACRRLVDLRVGQRVAANLTKAHCGATKPLREFLPFQCF